MYIPSTTCAAGADATGHAERVGERFDDLVRRGRHDVRRPSAVAVEVEQAAGLGADLAEQRREHALVELDEVVLALALHEAEHAVADLVGGAVAGAAQLEQDRADRVAHELLGGDEPGAAPAMASVNADDPEISVRSRSKNAALGPELATPTYSLTSMPSVCPFGARRLAVRGGEGTGACTMPVASVDRAFGHTE